MLKLEGVETALLLVLFVSTLLEPVPRLLPELEPLFRGVALVELLGVVAELLLEGVLGELSVALLDAVEFVSVDSVDGDRVLLDVFIADPL